MEGLNEIIFYIDSMYFCSALFLSHFKVNIKRAVCVCMKRAAVFVKKTKQKEKENS